MKTAEPGASAGVVLNTPVAMALRSSRIRIENRNVRARHA